MLITVSAPGIRHIRRTRVIGFQQVTMPYLAALTPSHWTVSHIDEVAEPIDFTYEADVVGLTFHTPSAQYAYAVAAQFRAKGAWIALGGPHVTLLPDEAQVHGDSVFVGEAEKTWPRFLEDFECGHPQKRYDEGAPDTLAGLPMARKDLFHRKDHAAGVLCATRGCPGCCEFCTLAAMYSRRFRKRPVDEVAQEFGSFKGKTVIFWDDNIAADLDYAKELCRAVTPYRKWWSSQASVHAGYDDEFLALAARSGCKQLFLGLESVCQDSLDHAGKAFNRVEEYQKIIHNIHAHGISVQVGLVFGFDQDTPAVFDDTIRFLEQNGVQNATFNMLTPYPGTPLFHRLEREGRILTRDWDKYNGRTDVVFQPKHMSCEELQRGFDAVNRRVYSPGSIIRRLGRSPVGLWWTLPLNVMYTWRYASARKNDEKA